MEEYGPASINSPDLKGTELMEKVIGPAAPVYEDTFDDYDIEDSAEKGETLESRDGTKQYSMNNDSFVVKEDVKGNRYYRQWLSRMDRSWDRPIFQRKRYQI